MDDLHVVVLVELSAYCYCGVQRAYHSHMYVKFFYCNLISKIELGKEITEQ